MKVRVLTDTVPAWLAPHLEQHDVTTGDGARAECANELWPAEPYAFDRRGSKRGVWRHGSVGTYRYGCRCDDCREAHRRYKKGQR